MTLHAALHARARKIRERALILAWEYRQRHHSKGAWGRLRRVLAETAEAWVIDAEDAERLHSLGKTPLAVGREFEPKKRLFIVNSEELVLLESRRAVVVGLRKELLDAENLALVPFDTAKQQER